MKDFNKKVTFTFEGKRWKRCKYHPILYVLNYIFSTDGFTLYGSEKSFYSYSSYKFDNFYRFKNIIDYIIPLDKEISNSDFLTITNKSGKKVFEFNPEFRSVVKLYKKAEKNLFLKSDLNYIDKDNILKIYRPYEGYDKVESSLLNSISIKENKIELYITDHNSLYHKISNDIINISSCEKLMEDIDLLKKIKGHIIDCYNTMTYPFKTFDSLDKDFIKKHEKELQILKYFCGIKFEKNRMGKHSSFYISKQIYTEKTINEAIKGLNSLRELLGPLKEINMEKEEKYGEKNNSILRGF